MISTWPGKRTLIAKWLLSLWSCLWLQCAWTVPAAAAQPTPAAEKEALSLANQAKARYAAKDYAESARLFMAAYGYVPEPTLLFNAARSFQQAGRLREALPLFQLYASLEHYSDAESKAGRREAEQHIAAIQAELQRQGQPLVTPPKAVEPGKAPAADPQPTPAKPQPDVSVPTPPPAAGTQPPTSLPEDQNVHRPGLFERIRPAPEDRSRYRTAALVTGGTGLVLLLTGAVLRSLAGNDLSDLEARLQDDEKGHPGVHPTVTQKEAQDAYDSHNGKQVAGGTLIGVGVLAIGAGVALWLLQTEGATSPASTGLKAAARQDFPNQGPRLWPTLLGSDGVAGFALAGRF